MAAGNERWFAQATLNLALATAYTIYDFAFPAGVVEIATMIKVCVKTAGVLVSFNGTVPTALNGAPIADGQVEEEYGEQHVRRFQVIRESAAANVTVMLGA